MHAKKRAEEEVIEALSDDKTIRLQTPTVISTVGSGVGKSTCSTLRSIGAGDFGAQSFNRVYILLTPYRHASPLEMTVTTSRSPVIWISENCVQNDGPGRKAPQRLTSDV